MSKRQANTMVEQRRNGAVYHALTTVKVRSKYGQIQGPGRHPRLHLAKSSFIFRVKLGSTYIRSRLKQALNHAIQRDFRVGYPKWGPSLLRSKTGFYACLYRVWSKSFDRESVVLVSWVGEDQDPRSRVW